MFCGYLNIIRHPWMPWDLRDATGNPKDSGYHYSRNTSQRGFLWLVAPGEFCVGACIVVPPRWHSHHHGRTAGLQRRGVVTEAGAGQKSSQRCPSLRATSPVNQEPQTSPDSHRKGSAYVLELEEPFLGLLFLQVHLGWLSEECAWTASCFLVTASTFKERNSPNSSLKYIHPLEALLRSFFFWQGFASVSGDGSQWNQTETTREWHELLSSLNNWINLG